MWHWWQRRQGLCRPHSYRCSQPHRHFNPCSLPRHHTLQRLPLPLINDSSSTSNEPRYRDSRPTGPRSLTGATRSLRLTGPKSLTGATRSLRPTGPRSLTGATRSLPATTGHLANNTAEHLANDTDFPHRLRTQRSTLQRRTTQKVHGSTTPTPSA